MNSPLVTIALPVLNGGAFLKFAVSSIQRQSFTNWELLIIDDGSTDDAIASLKDLSDKRILIVRDGFNCGLSARLNQAALMANGKYFARMDHDDICHPDRLARQVEYLERYPEVDLVATQCMTINEEGLVNGVLPYDIEHNDICRRPWRSFYMPHPTWMGRIEWFRKTKYQDPAPYCCEDQQLLLKAYKNSHYHTLPEYLLAYRVRTCPNWHKLVKTNQAMFKMQVHYFRNERDFGNLVLCSIAAVVRFMRDSSIVLGSKILAKKRYVPTLRFRDKASAMQIVIDSIVADANLSKSAASNHV